jgi:hypothetical protein
MARPSERQQLLRDLQALAEQLHTEDTEILEKVERCQSVKNACVLLSHALAESAGGRSPRDRLVPCASWIHPVI